MTTEWWDDPLTGDRIVNGNRVRTQTVFALADDLEADYGHKPSQSLPLAFRMCVGAAMRGEAPELMLNPRGEDR